jgi:hypothetical protein
MPDDSPYHQESNGDDDDIGGWSTGIRESLGGLANHDLLMCLDMVLVELERRLLHYARVGGQALPMADEGLVLATRTAARLRQTQSATGHAAGHLQIVGVGDWRPSSTNPSWSDDPRVSGDDD